MRKIESTSKQYLETERKKKEKAHSGESLFNERLNVTKLCKQNLPSLSSYQTCLKCMIQFVLYALLYGPGIPDFFK